MATNKAALEIQRLGLSLKDLMEASGKSKPMASQYKNGVKRPLMDVRLLIAKKYPTIKPSMWDADGRGPLSIPEPVAATNSPPPAAFAPVATSSQDPERQATRDRMEALLAHIVRSRQAAEDEGRTGDALKYLAQEQRALMDIAKFAGELNALDESRLTETKRWIQIRSTIAKALAPHPEAAEAVADALEELKA